MNPSDRPEFSSRITSLLGQEQVFFQPGLLGSQGFAAFIERPQAWPANGAEVGEPLPGFVRLDVAAASDGQRAQDSEVDSFGVETADLAPRINHELHRSLH
jgi:hypothetical protein